MGVNSKLFASLADDAQTGKKGSTSFPVEELLAFSLNDGEPSMDKWSCAVRRVQLAPSAAARFYRSCLSNPFAPPTNLCLSGLSREEARRHADLHGGLNNALRIVSKKTGRHPTIHTMPCQWGKFHLTCLPSISLSAYL